MAKYLDLDGVSYLWSKIKLLIPTYFVPATPTQEGIVTVDSQWFAGAKGARILSVARDDSGGGSFRFYRSNEGGNSNLMGMIWNDVKTVNSKSVLDHIYIRQYSYTASGDQSDYYESYHLPSVAASLSSDQSYNIITSKDRTTTLFTGTFNSSSSAVTLTDGMKYNTLVLLGRPGDSYNASCTVIVDNITTSDVTYQIAGAANYFCVNIKSSGDNVIMSYNSTSNTSSGRISRVYGIT